MPDKTTPQHEVGKPSGFSAELNRENFFSKPKLAITTAVVMVAFAANSILCREALASGLIGVADFTLARLASGAAILWLLVAFKRRRFAIAGDWLSAAVLFGYASCFSFAYVALSAGTGALLLFGAVQITMISYGLVSGERLTAWQSMGALSAFAGLVWFMLPGVQAPPIAGALLMIAAGVCWGIYSLRGRNASDATVATAGNFVRSLPLVVVLYLLASGGGEPAAGLGWIYALASGALASGLGYALWYSVLPSLSAATSATVQLSVPLIAAAGGWIFLAEALTARLLIASAIVLGGIFIFINSGRRT
ncbi:MAG: DMT family transporter [Gammaproteobacteria bacterium]|nr:DMT family transporter [Gammaproteobacteria bacterium]